MESPQSMLLSADQNMIMRMPNFGTFMHQQVSGLENTVGEDDLSVEIRVLYCTVLYGRFPRLRNPPIVNCSWLGREHGSTRKAGCAIPGVSMGG